MRAYTVAAALFSATVCGCGAKEPAQPLADHSPPALSIHSASSSGASISTIKPGDRVVIVTDGAQLTLGDQVVATLTKGQELPVQEIKGEWFGTYVTVNGDEKGGWMKLRDVKSADHNAVTLAKATHSDHGVRANGPTTTTPDEPIGERRRLEAGMVTSVAFSPDARFVLSGGEDGKVRLWEVSTGLEAHRFQPHKDTVTSVAFSSDGRFIASGSDDHTVRVWDFGTRREMCRLEDRAFIKAVNLSSDGRLIVLGSVDFVIKSGPQPYQMAFGSGLTLYDVTARSNRFQLKGNANAVAISPDDKLAIASRDDTMQLVDLATGEAVRDFTGHSASVMAAAFSRDGQRVFSASVDKTIRVWDVETGREETRCDYQERVFCIAVSPEGQRFAFGGGGNVEYKEKGGPPSYTLGSGAVCVWDIQGNEIIRFDGPVGAVSAIAMSSDGRYAVSGAQDNTLRLWRLPALETEPPDAHRGIDPPKVVLGEDKDGHFVELKTILEKQYLRADEAMALYVFLAPETGPTLDKLVIERGGTMQLFFDSATKQVGQFGITQNQSKELSGYLVTLEDKGNTLIRKGGPVRLSLSGPEQMAGEKLDLQKLGPRARVSAAVTVTKGGKFVRFASPVSNAVVSTGKPK